MQATRTEHARDRRTHASKPDGMRGRTARRRPDWIYRSEYGRAARHGIGRDGSRIGARRRISPEKWRHLHRDGIGSPARRWRGPLSDEGREPTSSHPGERTARLQAGQGNRPAGTATTNEHPLGPTGWDIRRAETEFPDLPAHTSGKGFLIIKKGGGPRGNIPRGPPLRRSAVHRSAAPCSPTGFPRSTIGAGRLSFRVRNGTGRAPAARTADRWAALRPGAPACP